jgi:(R,R)-butanediol dehydrogenase/meso-butanediol dehydrogenase/diacetyl reductase
MLTARWHGQEDVRVDDIPEPELEPDEIRINIEAAGICGTGLHEYSDGPDFVPPPRAPIL